MTKKQKVVTIEPSITKRGKILYCNKCGQKLKGTESYCSKCGSLIKIKDQDQLLENIVVRLKAGDKKAFDEFYAETQKYVRYVARQFFKDPNQVEDVVQEVYMTVYQKIESLKDPSAAWNWIKTITRNISLNMLEKNKKYVLLPEEDEYIFETLEELKVETLPVEAMESKELKSVLKDMLKELPVLQKMVLLEYYYNNRKISEIAEAYDLVEGTVKSYLSRGRKALAERLTVYQKRTGVPLYSFSLGALLHWAFQEEIQSVPVKAKLPTVVSAEILKNKNKHFGILKRITKKGMFMKSTVGIATAISVGTVAVQLKQDKYESEIIHVIETFEDACQELNDKKAKTCFSLESQNALKYTDLMKEYENYEIKSIYKQTDFDLQILDVEKISEGYAKVSCAYVWKNAKKKETREEGFLKIILENGEWRIDLCRANKMMYKNGNEGKNTRFPELIHYELVYNDELDKKNKK